MSFTDLASNQVILLAGSGRSGTTWVQELINHQHDYRVLFEPFRPEKVPFVAHFNDRQYLRPTDEAPEFRTPALAILQGQYRNPWFDQFTLPGSYHKRLVKEIRAHFLLKWCQQQVMPGLKIIFLMRHPCAVALSRLDLGWTGKKVFPAYEQQPALIEDFLHPFLSLNAEIQDDFERAILLWAIDNYVPLQQFRSDEWHLLFYEELVAYPERELTRLFAFLEQPMPSTIFTSVTRPSALAKADSAITRGQNPLFAWHQKTSREQRHRAITILSHFGLDAYYNDEPMPRSTHHP